MIAIVHVAYLVATHKATIGCDIKCSYPVNALTIMTMVAYQDQPSKFAVDEGSIYGGPWYCDSSQHPHMHTY